MSVPIEVCKKHLTLCANAPKMPLFLVMCCCLSQSKAPLQLFCSHCPSQLLFFLYFSSSIFISFHHALLCFHSILLSRCTPWHPGEQWFYKSLCIWLVDLLIGQYKSENNTKVSFPFFTPGRLRFADSPGLVIRDVYYASCAAYDLAHVELALTWVIWQ